MMQIVNTQYDYDIDECGVILLDYQRRCVMIVYQNESRKWGLPKGRMSEDERSSRDYFECAIRELNEETGIDLKMNGCVLLGSVQFWNKLFFAIQLNKYMYPRLPLDKREIRCSRWLPLSDLKQFVSTASCNVTLRALVGATKNLLLCAC